ncbi:helix-turn-helix domain-containing protein [Sinirhodobacter populi]|uniref:Helix-turn-helix domain-containing protein n=1 Tax=Paenirhodobacter populi TaxID=2306993 RepID=A0A443K6F4_9RHOB|nr:helix-turn-helix domain-containing protein [Sinirhodobacter populi]
MKTSSQDSARIPVFNLFGETGAFPDVIHCERIWDRARLHDWVISPHRHREMAQLFHMGRGAAEVRVDGREVRLADGDFLFVPAQAVHGFAFRQGCEGLVLSFPLTVVTGFAPDALRGRLARPIHGAADPRMLSLLDQIAATFSGTGPFRAPLLIALAQGVLAIAAEIALRKAEEVEPLSQRRMLEFDRLIGAHLGEGWGMEDYASALSITPGHLNRICRAAIGESALRHIEAAVMTEASRLLAFTRLPVAEIGYRLGYADPPYFSRRFRAVRGETPTAYRARFDG